MWSADTSVQGSGGFLDQTYSGQTNNQQSNKTETVRSNAVVPLMIGHLEDSPETLNLWGMPIKLITLVAFVRKVERATTKVSYELVDETGSIMGYQWVEDDNSPNLVTVPAGTYARVIGSPREQGDSRHVFILKIEQVDQLAEVFEHLLEVTFACLKGEVLLTDPEPCKIGSTMEFEENDGCNGMNKEQVMVFKIIQSANDTESGIERSQLKAKIPSSIHNRINEILEFLVCEGHIYTTCTDDHFKTT